MNLLFIPSLLIGDYRTFFIKLSIVAGFWILVIIASLIDLRSGIKASKSRGQFRTTSSGLRQTLRKDKEYISFMFMAFIVDFSLSYLSALSDVFSILSIFQLPLISIVVLIGILITEWISVNENIRKKNGSDVIPKETIDFMTDIISAVGEDKLKAIAELIKSKEAQK